MDSNSSNDWKALKLGDKIRIARMPSVFNAPHYRNGDWDETFALYRLLILNQEVLAIAEIDDEGRPWIEFESLDAEGAMVSHSLAIDDDSWELAD